MAEGGTRNPPRNRKDGSGHSSPKGARAEDLSRPRLGGAQGLEQEASHQVVRQDTDLLPGAVGSIVVGGDHIQSELSLEFGESFLLGSTFGHNLPSGWGAECFVGGYGRVLEVPIIGGE